MNAHAQSYVPSVIINVSHAWPEMHPADFEPITASKLRVTWLLGFRSLKRLETV
jgi:hypothetical protein